MPKYHFDLVDTRTVHQGNDDERDCETVEAAKEMAKELAARFAEAEPDFLKGYSILVTDSGGVEIFRAQVKAKSVNN